MCKNMNLPIVLGKHEAKGLLKCAENPACSEPNSCRLLQTSKGRWCQLTIGCLHVLIKALRSRDDEAKHKEIGVFHYQCFSRL